MFSRAREYAHLPLATINYLGCYAQESDDDDETADSDASTASAIIFHGRSRPKLASDNFCAPLIDSREPRLRPTHASEQQQAGCKASLPADRPAGPIWQPTGRRADQPPTSQPADRG